MQICAKKGSAESKKRHDIEQQTKGQIENTSNQKCCLLLKAK
jgi:hypothetical protein